MNDIKVSIALITYKHAPYIRQCLDTILSQKVNFKYQIVVGEDCSNDGTKEILLEYKEKYPDIFVLLINEENMGASRNAYRVKQHCVGQYVMGGEGDDFWIDDERLQKQVDFLDSHPEYMAVGTNYVAVSHEGTDPIIAMPKNQINRRYTFEDFLRYGFIVKGNTLMYRNVLPTEGERYEKLRFAEPTMGDIITRVLIYDKGDIYVLPDVTHAHRDGRQNPTSFTATHAEKTIEYIQMYFRIVDNLTAYFDNKYDLAELKADRLSLAFLQKVLGMIKVDSRALWGIWKKQRLKVRVLSLTRMVRRLFFKVLYWVYRKIK